MAGMLRVLKILSWPLMVAAVYGILHFLASCSIYYPASFPKGWWEIQAGLGASDVWLRAKDGVQLHGWWVRRPDSDLVTLFFHGNAGNLTHRERHIREIFNAGSSVLIIDYRGYGKSQGHPCEHGLYADAEAAYEHLRDRGYGPERIVLHGESLGTVVAIDLASRKPCAAVVLEAPFTSARAVAARVLPLLGPLLIWGYEAKAKVRLVKAPLLVIHGSRDEVIDFRFGKELFEAANEPKIFWAVSGAGHNDIIEVAGPLYGLRLRALYDVVRWQSPGRSSGI